MSKILMISSNTFAYPYPVYPLGMAIVSAALTERGHSVRQFDFYVQGKSEEKLKDVIREFCPDYIGISIRNIDDVDSLNNDKSVLTTEKQIVNLIRNHTNAPVIAGGAALSIMPEEVMACIGADYGIIGAGEEKINELIDSLESGSTFPGITGKHNASLKVPVTAPPMRDKCQVEFYLAKSGMLNIQTKRGCPFNCSYCVYPSLEGKRFRFCDQDRIIADLEHVQREYNADTFFITDSVFNDPEGRYLELAEKIISSGLKIRWAGYFRPKGIGRQELRLLKRSGLYAVEVGSDAGSDETLHSMGKGFTFNDVLDFYNNCVSEGISSAYFFIFGGPGETEKTLTEGLSNIRKLKDGVIFIYSGIRILPDTPLYRQALSEGILSKEDSMLNPVYYFSPHINVKEMNSRIEQEARMNRKYIFPPEKGKMMADAMHAFGYKGLLWDELIAFSNRFERRGKKQ